MWRPATESERQELEGRGVGISSGGDVLVFGEQDGLAGWMVWSPQPFETQHLGFRSARITAFDVGCDAARLRAAYSFLGDAGYDFLSFRIASDRADDVRTACQSGAVEIERLVTLVLDLTSEHDLRHAAGSTLPEGIALAQQSDAEACAVVGERSFTSDRFHLDPRIDDQRADRLKADWMRNACLGRADKVLVAQSEDEIVGVNACLFRDGEAIIDLIGVLPLFQGLGWGRKLVEGAIIQYSGTAERMLVGTQADNTSSLALYRSVGFLPIDEKVTFHVHIGTLS